MKYAKYFTTLAEAATSMGARGLPWAENAGVVSLVLTFTSTDSDDDEGTDITMDKTFIATIVELTDGTWRIDEIAERETTVEISR